MVCQDIALVCFVASKAKLLKKKKVLGTSKKKKSKGLLKEKFYYLHEHLKSRPQFLGI